MKLKPAPSTFALLTVAVLALLLGAFAAGMEFANVRHEAAAAPILARIHQLEAGCRRAP